MSNHESAQLKPYSWRDNHLVCLPQDVTLVPPLHERPGHDRVVWFLHYRRDLILLKKIIQSLDILKLTPLRAFSLHTTIRKAGMFKSEMCLQDVNNATQ